MIQFPSIHFSVGRAVPARHPSPPPTTHAITYRYKTDFAGWQDAPDTLHLGVSDPAQAVKSALSYLPGRHPGCLGLEITGCQPVATDTSNALITFHKTEPKETP